MTMSLDIVAVETDTVEFLANWYALVLVNKRAFPCLPCAFAMSSLLPCSTDRVQFNSVFVACC